MCARSRTHNSSYSVDSNETKLDFSRRNILPVCAYRQRTDLVLFAAPCQEQTRVPNICSLIRFRGLLCTLRDLRLGLCASDSLNPASGTETPCSNCTNSLHYDPNYDTRVVTKASTTFLCEPPYTPPSFPFPTSLGQHHMFNKADSIDENRSRRANSSTWLVNVPCFGFHACMWDAFAET